MPTPTRHPALTVVSAASTVGTSREPVTCPTCGRTYPRIAFYAAPHVTRCPQPIAPARVYRLTADRATWPDALDALIALRHR